MATKVIHTAYSGVALTEIYIVYDYSQNIANNTTTVTAEARWKKLHSGATGWRGTPQTFTLTVGGSAKTHAWTFDIRNVGVGATGHITSHSRTISHNSDGSLTPIEIKAYCATGTTSFGTINGSFTFSVPTIPRSSTAALDSNQATGVERTVTINKASSSFTHKIHARLGSYSTWLSTGTSASSFKWTPSHEICKEFPNSTYGIGTLTCYTYSGSTHVGTTTSNFQINIPTGFRPTASLTLAGVELLQNRYVQDKSRVKVTVGFTGSYGSTIRSRSTTVTGITTSGSATFTSGYLKNAGTVTVTTTVTDSRGRTGTASQNISVQAYSSPKITSFSAYRSKRGGTKDSTGDYIRVSANALVSSAVPGIGTRSIRLSIRPVGGVWGNEQSGVASGTPTHTFIYPASSGSSFEVRAYISDYYNSDVRTQIVGTGFVLMDFNTSGQSMAIGKASEGKGVLEIGGGIHTTGEYFTEKGYHQFNTTDGYLQIGPQNSNYSHIYTDKPSFYFNKELQVNGKTVWNSGNLKRAERGYNSNGNYVKFHGGLMICWREDIPSPVGKNVHTYPQEFLEIPTVLAGTSKNLSGGSAALYAIEASDSSKGGFFAKIFRITSTVVQEAAVNTRFEYVAVGRWS